MQATRMEGVASPPPIDRLPEPERRRRRRRRRNLTTATLVLAALALLGGWVYYEVHRWAIRLLTDHLTTILEADVAALELWIRNEQSSARHWAGEPTLRAAIERLTRLDPEGLNTDQGHRDRQAVDRALSRVAAEATPLGYVIVGRSGLIIGSDEAFLVGRRMPPRAMPLAARILDGEAVVTAPFRVGDFFYADIPQAELPVVVKSAPVYGNGNAVIAALIVSIDPEEFSSILSIARFGDSGDTYAFGPNGWMLSDSRHVEQLKRIGLVPDRDGARSIFAFQIRDPGGNLLRGHKPERPLAEQPFTRMAAAALAGRSGIDLEGYRDYRGVRVVGAWKWLDAHGFGVATEAERKRVLGILTPIIVASAGLFGAVVLTVAGLLVNLLIVQRLKGRIEEVTRLGEYTLLEKIGEGGMGKVYLARHALLSRPTAVKFLRPDALSEATIARFEREVEMTSRLQHPSTVAIYDFGRTGDGIFYYAMEYLEGFNLARLIEIEGRVPPGRVVHVLRQVCLSLREAHAAGILHRDIKPMNIMLCVRGGEYDVVKVVDFGLVKDMRVPPEREETVPDVIPGTPPYIAPERLKREPLLDARADIYGLGAVGFNLLTGRPSFEGETPLDTCYKVLHEAPRLPSSVLDGAIPPDLDALVLAMLARNPGDRPQTIQEVLDRLDAVRGLEPWTARLAKAWWDTHPPPSRPHAGAENRAFEHWSKAEPS